MIEVLNSRPVLSNTLATCGNFNINSLQLNNIKNSVSQSHRPHFKSSIATCGFGYHIGQSIYRIFAFSKKVLYSAPETEAGTGIGEFWKAGEPKIASSLGKDRDENSKEHVKQDQRQTLYALPRVQC